MDYYEPFGIQFRQGKHEEEIFYNIVLIYSHIWDRIAKYLRPYHLTPSQFNALMIIKHQGQEAGLSQSQISKKLIVTESNITRLLEKLEKAGFIAHYAHESDRRVKLIKITQKGSTLLDKIWPGYEKTMAKFSKGLDRQTRRLLAELLKQMLGSMLTGRNRDE